MNARLKGEWTQLGPDCTCDFVSYRLSAGPRVIQCAAHILMHLSDFFAPLFLLTVFDMNFKYYY